jgi:hypothetical protein
MSSMSSPNEELERLRSLGVCPSDRVVLLLALMERCDSGTPQEKVSVKDGVLTVMERYPQVSLGCIREMGAIWDGLEKQQSPDAQGGNVIVNVSEWRGTNG